MPQINFGEHGGHKMDADSMPIKSGMPTGGNPGTTEIVMPSEPTVGGPNTSMSV
jgi:hypothetical protein